MSTARMKVTAGCLVGSLLLLLCGLTFIILKTLTNPTNIVDYALLVLGSYCIGAALTGLLWRVGFKLLFKLWR